MAKVPPQYLAVYGTLQKLHKTPMHILLHSSTLYLGPCEFEGELYTLGRYPGYKHGKGVVHGELYKIINPNLLPHLDLYEAKDNEGGSQYGFKRVLIKLTKPALSAWVYHYEGPVKPADRIRSGNWHIYLAYLHRPRL